MHLKIGIITFLMATLLPTSIAYAQDNNAGGIAKYIRKGDPAPFNGMLLDDKAAIMNKVRFEAIEKLHANEIEHTKALLDAEHNAALAALQVKLDKETQLHALDVEFLEKENKFLRDNYEPPGIWSSWKSGVIIGTGATIIVLLVSSYSIEKLHMLSHSN
jgi:hypothetical protein